MEFFKTQTNIDFMGIRRWTAAVSIVLLLGSIAAVLIKGLQWGVDFTGGYQVQVHFSHEADIPVIKHELHNAGLKEADVISFGSSKDIMIRLLPDEWQGSANASNHTQQQQLQARIHEALGNDASITAVNYIGPEVGQELATTGLLALVVALICIVAYIAFRFEFKFALSAGLALLHDPIIILGVFAAFGQEFNLTVLAAMLAVIGFSLNDTVVIYDRMRENFRKMRRASVVEIMNRSVNDTLARTVITSGLTLMVVVVLYFFGGPSINEFSLALILGVIVGTYSSIYVAGVLAVMFGLKRESLLPPEKPSEP